jgi:hypothetical protein
LLTFFTRVNSISGSSSRTVAGQAATGFSREEGDEKLYLLDHAKTHVAGGPGTWG